MGFKVQCFKAQMAFDGFKIDLDLNIFMAKNPKKTFIYFSSEFPSWQDVKAYNNQLRPQSSKTLH